MKQKDNVTAIFLSLEIVQKAVVAFFWNRYSADHGYFWHYAVSNGAKSSQMQLYTMDKNFDRMEQTMDNIQDRIGRIGSLVTVSDLVGDALRSDDSDGLVQELQKFDALSDYTYQLELSSDDISILYYIPEKIFAFTKRKYLLSTVK